MQTLEKQRMELERFIAEIYEGERKVLVHGEGRLCPRLMLIGEAPGEQETLQRRPFVGKAGKNLDEFLALVGLEREELYVSNTVKFRPTKISAAGRTVNRPPSREEIKLFLPWLQREIAAVQPELIVTLGNVPLKALTRPAASVGALHGAILEVAGLRIYPMYHPASMIYNPALRSVYEADIRRLADMLQRAGG